MSEDSTDWVTIRPFYGRIVPHTDAMGNLDWKEWKPNHRLGISADEQMRRNVANGYLEHDTNVNGQATNSVPSTRTNPRHM